MLTYGSRIISAKPSTSNIIRTSKSKTQGEFMLVSSLPSNDVDENARLTAPNMPEHCINSSREFIMCKADMTPIVLVPPEKAGVPVPVPEFRTKHVCRNFEQMAEWVRRERNADLPDEESLAIAKRIRAKTGTKY
jgi:hypothetical protein